MGLPGVSKPSVVVRRYVYIIMYYDCLIGNCHHLKFV